MGNLRLLEQERLTFIRSHNEKPTKAKLKKIKSLTRRIDKIECAIEQEKKDRIQAEEDARRKRIEKANRRKRAPAKRHKGGIHRKKAVNVYKITGQYVQSYDSVVEASQALNIGRTAISRACKLGRKKDLFGYSFEFAKKG